MSGYWVSTLLVGWETRRNARLRIEARQLILPFGRNSSPLYPPYGLESFRGNSCEGNCIHLEIFSDTDSLAFDTAALTVAVRVVEARSPLKRAVWCETALLLQSLTPSVA